MSVRKGALNIQLSHDDVKLAFLELELLEEWRILKLFAKSFQIGLRTKFRRFIKNLSHVIYIRKIVEL